MNATPESLIKDYADPIEQQEIDKFVCSEMGRQIHRYIKGMSGIKQAMLKFEERLVSLSVPEKEKAIAKYIDLNRKALEKHIENLKLYGVPVVVTLNSFITDTEAEISYVKNFCEERGAEFALSEVWGKGR